MLGNTLLRTNSDSVAWGVWQGAVRRFGKTSDAHEPGISGKVLVSPQIAQNTMSNTMEKQSRPKYLQRETARTDGKVVVTRHISTLKQTRTTPLTSCITHNSSVINLSHDRELHSSSIPQKRLSLPFVLVISH